MEVRMVLNRIKTIFNIAIRLFALMLVILTGFPAGLPANIVQAAPASPQAAVNTVDTLHLRVESARTEPLADGGAGVVKGQAAAKYKWIINQDNVSDPTQPRQPFCDPATNANYPEGCNWPSIHPINGFAPVVTQGDDTELNENTGITLPAGKYLISVWADGYKIDGAHFTIPLADPGLVTVTAQPLPLPSATVRIKVFQDNASVNGQPDEPAETGLAGFSAKLADILGTVSTDVFGNPICTVYQKDANGKIVFNATGKPVIQTIGGLCYSDANGDVTIPNMGPNRYTATVIAPSGQTWVQTTTLEGNIDFDTWVMEGQTGYDTELTVGNEPFPPTFFGFVKPQTLPVSSAKGEVKGIVAGVKVYVPAVGGLNAGGTIWGGFAGTKIDKPIDGAWVALSDLTRGDQAVYVGQADAKGAFDIKNVPDGDYSLTLWDAQISYILDIFNVSVRNGEVVDTGLNFLTGWWANLKGKVCVDDNSNGKCDPGEKGVPNYLVGTRRRENTYIDRGTVTAVTDAGGNYVMDNLYPLTSWVIIEAYNNAYYTTGVTYQSDNEPNETTVLGSGVDFSVLPIIGLGGRLDWAVRPYDTVVKNGGIVGTVSYDSTRNELDPAYAAVEAYQPGIPGITVSLYEPVINPDGTYAANPDGSYVKGALLQSYQTDAWGRPKNCTARDVYGNPINDPGQPNANVQQHVLPANTGNYDCLEAPMMGMQFGQGSQDGFTPVDGNFSFGDLVSGKYLAEVEIPTDTFGKPIYKVTAEEDVNVFTGDTYTPQIAPPECVGPTHVVHVTNADFLSVGGSIYEGQTRHSCNLKLVDLKDGRSNDLMFNLFTDVPVPGRFLGYIVDDLNIATDPNHLLFGEKAGIAAPIGLYDYSNRLITTIQSDPNGLFEVLLPSTSTYNCPLPAGPCPGMYRLVGNDPGQPGRLNPTYNPKFRTISATFEIWPGMIVPADLAPTQVGVSIQSPGSQQNFSSICALPDTTPQLFAVSKPYVNGTGSFTISGLHFGASQGGGAVMLDNIALTVNSWSDTQINVSVPAGLPAGPHQLMIRADNGQSPVNGLTFHVLGQGYTPTLFEVGPGKTYATVQSALEAAGGVQKALVVVYPGTADTFNPKGVYYENVVMHSPVKLQGVGPGGVYTDGSVVPGSIISGSGFNADQQAATDWRNLINSLTWSGNQTPLEGEVIYVLARNNQFNASYRAAIDGFSIEGGDQLGFPANINQVGGGSTGNPAGVVETQGGGIYVNGYASYLQITNNILASNGGTFAGAIRVGTPNIGSNHNDHLRIAYNQVIDNGGSNLAGAIGLFNGSDNYEIAYNDICGNFSAEYGGGISHYGFSPNGSIHHNRVYYNRAYDEAGGVLIAGELPANPNQLSVGAGPVDIYNNIIQGNLSNDDGGGIRFLMSGDFPYNVYNNMLVNNVATHEGGGIAIDDAPNVRVYNNTIVKNITTATSMTSNGLPAPAGLSTTSNSAMLQATLPPGAPLYSRPLLFNNIFWDNRAGSWDQLHGGCVQGIGLPAPCPNPNVISHYDIGVSGSSDSLFPRNSILQQLDPGVVDDGSNKVGVDPLLTSPFDMTVSVLPGRGNVHFVGIDIVAVNVPSTLMGDYHLQAGSPAIDAGAATVTGTTDRPVTVTAAPQDIDHQPRPNNGLFDIGADEFYTVPPVSTVIPGSFTLMSIINTMHYFFLPVIAY